MGTPPIQEPRLMELGKLHFFGGGGGGDGSSTSSMLLCVFLHEFSSFVFVLC